MMENAYKRRRFLYHFGQAAVAAPYLDLISLDAVGSDYATSLQTGQGSHRMSQGKKLGVALVGLGQYSEEQLAPALQQTKLCKLTAIVTGTPKKQRNGKRSTGLRIKIFTAMRISIG
jgi:hypothetical protein